MKQYKKFIFERYEFDQSTRQIKLHYSLDDEVRFTETLLLPDDMSVSPFDYAPSFASLRKDRQGDTLDRALFALHLIGGISYFKTCLPKEIEIRSGTLNKKQANFWNTVYTKGLGEFFYKNQIDFRGLINFPYDDQKIGAENAQLDEGHNPAKKVLVPIGGGKDSMVTAELLKKGGFNITLFRMGDHPVIRVLAETAQLPLLTVKRALSPALFKLNEEGALNGHVPITAYLSFVNIVIAELFGFEAVILSNEHSASFGNVSYLEKEINHQWSKSLEAEKLLQNYLNDHIKTNVRYFSLLRPFSELKICQIFSAYPQYYKLVTSCNKNWKLFGEAAEKRWCGKCPKCAFVFALFAAFLKKDQLNEIFGNVFFEDSALLPLYRELIGLEGFKPFECVGTPDETKAAFLLAYKRGDLNNTLAMKMFESEVLPGINDPDKLIESVLKPGEEDVIPEEFKTVFSDAL